MAKKPKNHGKGWTPAQVKKLRELARGNTPTGLIAWELGRTKPSVRAKASEKNITLKPVNRSPYNRKKKK
jgi:hypothetical protein